MYKVIPKEYIIAPGTMLYLLSTPRRPGSVFVNKNQLKLLNKYYGISATGNDNRIPEFGVRRAYPSDNFAYRGSRR